MSSGCGCKEEYRFPHTTYPYSSCIYLLFFCSSIPTFCSFKKYYNCVLYVYTILATPKQSIPVLHMENVARGAN